MSKRTRKAPVERKAPTKRGKAALAKTVSISLIEEEEEEPV
jgi:hypothetical protein